MYLSVLSQKINLIGLAGGLSDPCSVFNEAMYEQTDCTSIYSGCLLDQRTEQAPCCISIELASIDT